MTRLPLLCVLVGCLETILATPVCVYDNQFYISDTEIFVHSCNVAYCDKMARLVYKDGCSVTARDWPVQQTTIPTMVPTTPVGCYYNGKYYMRNTQISKSEDRTNNWCYSTYCDYSGQIQHADDFNCFPTTATPATYMVLTKVTPTTFGCNYNGKHYPLNTEIYKGEDRTTNFCYSTYCDDSGHIRTAGNPHCFPTAAPPTAVTATPTAVPTTILPPPTTVPTTPVGCYFNSGKFYPANTILSGTGGRPIKYCTKCDENGQIQHWYDDDCFRGSTTAPIGLIG